jgi:hypothetical protein
MLLGVLRIVARPNRVLVWLAPLGFSETVDIIIAPALIMGT